MKILRKARSAIFLLAALISAVFCFAPYSRALGASPAVRIEDVAFYMEKGASVRTVAGSSGLRFTALMDKAEYKGLISNPDYYSVGFGMLIMPADYIDKYGALSPETVFGENAVYNPEDEGDGVKIIGLYSDELHEYHADNSEMCFYGAITNIRDYNLCREFVGAGYIKVKGAFGVKYKFAADNDNRRSAVYVAQRALRAGGYDEISREILNGYVSAAAEEETFYTVETYLCAEKTVLESTQTFTAKVGETVAATAPEKAGYALDTERSVLSGEAFANGKTVLRLYYESESPCTVDMTDEVFACFETGEEISLDGLYGSVTEIIGNKTSAGEKVLTAVTDKNRTYRIRVCIADKIIKSAEDFSALEENPEGYYVLACDLTGAGNLFVSAEFNGTLDGMCHKITGLNLKNAEGLFSFIGARGTVKNLAVISSYAERSAFAGEIAGKAENLFIKSPDATRAVERLSGSVEKSVILLPTAKYAVNEFSGYMDNVFAFLGNEPENIHFAGVGEYGYNYAFIEDVTEFLTTYDIPSLFGGNWRGDEFSLRFGENFVITK